MQKEKKLFAVSTEPRGHGLLQPLFQTTACSHVHELHNYFRLCTLFCGKPSPTLILPRTTWLPLHVHALLHWLEEDEQTLFTNN